LTARGVAELSYRPQPGQKSTLKAEAVSRRDQRALSFTPRAFVADGQGGMQSHLLPSGLVAAAPAHGFTQVVSPTACRFPPPMPDRSSTLVSRPSF